MFTDKELDEIRILYISKISLDDIAVYYDFDSTEDFTKKLQDSLNKAYQIFLLQIPPTLQSLSEQRLKATKKVIEKIRTSPERVNRLLKKKVIQFALSLSTFQEIAKAVGKSKEDLEKIISESEVLRLNEEALALIRQKQFQKALTEGDVKMLTHLGESYIEKQKKESPVTNLQINSDNRKVVILPAAKPIQQLLEEQKDAK